MGCRTAALGATLTRSPSRGSTAGLRIIRSPGLDTLPHFGLGFEVTKTPDSAQARDTVLDDRDQLAILIEDEGPGRDQAGTARGTTISAVE